MKPSVDIALATYNGEKYLDALLQSLVAQQYENLRVVVSDDASTDETRKIVDSFQGRLKIDFIAGDKTIGVVANFERAIANCKADYIALADQDDIWHPEKVSALVSEIRRVESTLEPKAPVLAFSDIAVVDENIDKIAESFFSFTIKSSQARSFADFALANHVPGCAMMFNRALVKVALPLPEIRMHDFWLIQVAALIGKISFVEKNLISYRQHSNNSVGIGASSTSLLKRARVRLTLLPNVIRSRPEKWRIQAQFVRLHAHQLRKRLPSANLSDSDRRLLDDLAAPRSFGVLFAHLRNAHSGERFIDTIGVLWALARARGAL